LPRRKGGVNPCGLVSSRHGGKRKERRRIGKGEAWCLRPSFLEIEKGGRRKKKGGGGEAWSASLAVAWRREEKRVKKKKGQVSPRRFPLLVTR